MADAFVAEALAEELSRRGEVAGKSFLLLRADIGRPVLVERLKASGAANVTDLAVYETRRVAALTEEATAAIAAGDVDWMTFTSSSTARNLVDLIGGAAAIQKCKVASIGPVTSATLRELGLTVTVEADRHDLDGLVDAVAASISIRSVNY